MGVSLFPIIFIVFWGGTYPFKQPTIDLNGFNASRVPLGYRKRLGGAIKPLLEAGDHYVAHTGSPCPLGQATKKEKKRLIKEKKEIIILYI